MKKLRIDYVESIKEENVDHSLHDDTIGDIIKSTISDQLVLFQETLNRYLKKKDDESKKDIKTLDDNYMKTFKELEERHQEELINLEAKIKTLETENKKLLSEVKSKKKQQKCKECEENLHQVSNLNNKLNDLKISQAAEDVRMKKHVFKRQEKVKRYKQLLIEKDQEIIEREEEIVKYQEEIYAFERKLKEKGDKLEDLVPTKEGEKASELVHDPVEELLSPVKPAENYSIDSQTIFAKTNHSSLLTLVEDAANFYKSSISSEATGDTSKEKKSEPGPETKQNSLKLKIEGVKSRGVTVKRSKALK